MSSKDVRSQNRPRDKERVVDLDGVGPLANRHSFSVLERYRFLEMNFSKKRDEKSLKSRNRRYQPLFDQFPDL